MSLDAIVRFSPHPVLVLVCSLFAFAGCSKKDVPTPSGAAAAEKAGEKPAAATGQVTLQGSGASFPAPLYSRWFKEFSSQSDGVRVNYQATGSGAGIKAFTEGQTDFGASDAAMTDDEIKAAKDNVVLLPMTAGSIVIAYNLEGVAELKLPRDVYPRIFLGEVKKWNDPAIAKANPGAKLPDKAISVVHRSDGSGTTFAFTTHLAAVSEKWKSGPGIGKSINWPVGVGGQKNDGVAALIKQTPGGIGYIEYAYAVTSKQPVASLENKGGKFVAPTLKAAEASLASLELPADLRAWVADPTGDGSYPIVTYTWILAKKDYENDATADALKKLLKWCLADGQKLSEELHYIKLPDAVTSKVLAAVDTIK